MEDMTIPDDYLDAENWEEMACPRCKKAWSVSKYAINKTCNDCGVNLISGKLDYETEERRDSFMETEFIPVSGEPFVIKRPIMFTTGALED